MALTAHVKRQTSKCPLRTFAKHNVYKATGIGDEDCLTEATSVEHSGSQGVQRNMTR